MKSFTRGLSLAVGVVAVLASSTVIAAAPSALPGSTSLWQTLQVVVKVEPQRPNFEIKVSDKNRPVNVCIMNNGMAFSWDLIDSQTLMFADAEPNRLEGRARDCDNDGKSDFGYVFTVSKLKLTPADTLACLDAKLTDGRKIRGCAQVKVVP